MILSSRVCAHTGVFTRVGAAILTVLRFKDFLGSQDQKAGEPLRRLRFGADPNSDLSAIPSRRDHREADPG